MGAYNEQNVVDHVWLLLRDYGDTAAKQLLTDTEIKALGQHALGQYTADRPREVVVDRTADGSKYLSLASLTVAWLTGWSQMRRVEHPIDKVPIELLDERGWQVQITPSTTRLVFADTVPSSGTLVRITYTAFHVLHASAASTTIPDPDFYAFCDFVGSLGADAIAAKYAQTHSPVVSADSADYRSKAREWQEVAKRLRGRYESFFGIGDAASASIAAAGATVNWDMRQSYGGGLTHERINR